jgi:hypothetical protein
VAGFSTNCQYDPDAIKNKFKPPFTQVCFDEIYNPANFQLNTISQSNHGKSDQLNLAAAIAVARNYHLGSHPSTFEVGFKIRPTPSASGGNPSQRSSERGCRLIAART